MIIDLSCQRCDGSFELEALELLEGESAIKCPNCDAHLSQSDSEDLGNALAELCKQVANVRKKFSVSLGVESDDLPPPYDGDVRDLDEEESDDDDDDELFDDRDEDDEDDDENEEEEEGDDLDYEEDEEF